MKKSPEVDKQWAAVRSRAMRRGAKAHFGSAPSQGPAQSRCAAKESPLVLMVLFCFVVRCLARAVMLLTAFRICPTAFPPRPRHRRKVPYGSYPLYEPGLARGLSSKFTSRKLWVQAVAWG